MKAAFKGSCQEPGGGAQAELGVLHDVTSRGKRRLAERRRCRQQAAKRALPHLAAYAHLAGARAAVLHGAAPPATVWRDPQEEGAPAAGPAASLQARAGRAALCASGSLSGWPTTNTYGQIKAHTGRHGRHVACCATATVPPPAALAAGYYAHDALD